MIRINNLISWSAIIFLFASCNENDAKIRQESDFLSDDKPITGDCGYYIEKYKTDNFSAIYIYDAFSVDVVVADTCGLSISGPRCYVENQNAYVMGNTLVVKFKDHDTHYRRTHIKISVPRLSDFEVMGAVYVTLDEKKVDENYLYVEMNNVNRVDFTKPIVMDELTVNLKKVTSANVNLKCNHFYFSTQDVEKTILSGKTNVATLLCDRSEKVDDSNIMIRQRR